MPRAKSNIVGRTELQTEIFDASKDRADCAVKAVAVVCGVSYEAAHERLASFGRKDGSGTHTHLINRAVQSFGFRQERVQLHEMIQRYPAAHHVLKSVTTHHPERFPAAFKDEPPMLFYTARHVAGFRDGLIHDYTRGRAVRAYMIYRVLPA